MNTIKISLTIMIAVVLLSFHSSNAQNKGDDMLEMSLEELMSIRVKQISLPDIPHVHAKREIMVSYHLMNMTMRNHFEGSHEISTDEVLNSYMVAPTEMSMNMHMFHIMYAPMERLTIMAMGGYQNKNMDHIMRSGQTFSTKSTGFSDLTLGALYTLHQNRGHRITGLLGLSLPVGDIEQKDAIPSSEGQPIILPYPMQIGSGTVDPNMGITYIRSDPNYGWGGDLRCVVRIAENDNGYRMGNELKLTSWYSRTFTDYFSLAAQFIYQANGNIEGADERLNPMMVYTADPNLRAGKYVKGGIVFTFHPQGGLTGLRFSGEFKHPLLTNLDGPQLAFAHENKFAITYVLGQK